MNGDGALRLLRVHLGHSEAFVGALPGDPPIEVPVPPGGRLIGSVVQPFPGVVHAYVEASGDPSEMLAFFEREYERRGWKGQEPSLPRHPAQGFVPSMGAPLTGVHMRVFCRGEDGPLYRLEIRPLDSPVIVVTHTYGQTGMPHPCSKEPVPRTGMHYPDFIPTLQGPPGVPIHGGGGGGGSDSWYTSGSAFTDMPAVSLLDHFAPQLEEQGGTLIDRGSSGPVAWGRWKLKKEGWEALVVVLEQRKDVRYLMLHAQSERAHDQMRMWRQYGSGWSSILG